MAEELRLELLGGMRFTLNGVTLSTFVSNKVPALLCYLAVTGRAHYRTSLAGLLWSDLPEDAARRNLRVVLTHLRQMLAPYLIITRDTVAFDRTSAYWLDVEQLEDALHDAASADSDRVRAAVALYTGDFLEGFYVRDAPLFDEWATVQRERLRQQVLHGLHELARISITRQEFAAGIAACARLLQLDPWREDAHRQLMQLLAHSGQRDAALTQYQTCRRMLHDEFGAEPGPETTALYEQIRASGFQAPAPIPARASNLPTAPTALLGRADERTRVMDLLVSPACRLLTLVGPGGIGKTRLSLDVADRLHAAFAAVVLVDLAPVQDAQLLDAAIARTLGVRETRDQCLLDSVKDYLRGKRTLLLLDNFEQVIPAAPVVAELLAACPDLTVLVTSRQELHVRGEQVFPVLPLALPDRHTSHDHTHLTDYAAVALFVERATHHQPSFTLTADNAAAVVEICRRLDGLPLAIELAAARITLFPPATLVQRLSNRLSLLTRGPRDLPVRQQTLQNTLDWSYTLLDTDEQTLFAQLAVFVGGWTIEAVEEICADRHAHISSTFDTLQGLLDKQLVQQELRADNHIRFTMLETIREYAQTRLTQQGNSHEFQRRHAAYYLASANTAAPDIEKKPSSGQVALIKREYDNQLAALQWMLDQEDSEGSLGLCNALSHLWDARGHLSEGRYWLRAALELPNHEASVVRADALEIAGRLAVEQGDWPQAVELMDHALTLSRTLADTRRIARLLRSQGWLALMRGEYGSATELLEESVCLYRTLGDKGGIAAVLGLQGQAAYEQQAFAQAKPLLTESLALSHALDDHVDAAWVINKLGLVALYQGNYVEAERLLKESLAIFDAFEYQRGSAWVIGSLGLVQLGQGAYAQAAELFKDSLTRYYKLGEKRNIAFCLERLASLATVQQQAVRAARLFGAAKALRQKNAVPLPPVDQEYYEPYLATLHTLLSDERMATAWTEGEALSLAQATEYALEGVAES